MVLKRMADIYGYWNHWNASDCGIDDLGEEVVKKTVSLKAYSEIHRLIGYCQSAKTIMELSPTQMISIKDDWFKSLLKRAESVLETMENDEAQASGGEK